MRANAGLSLVFSSRSPRQSVPSPLSTASNVATSPSSTNPPLPAVPATQQGFQPIGIKSAERTTSRAPVGQTTFYSDSSTPSSPEDETKRSVLLIPCCP